MGNKWMWLVTCGLLAAGAMVTMRGPDAGERQGARGRPEEHTGTARAAPALAWDRSAAAPRLTPHERGELSDLDDDLDDWTTAEIEAALDALIGDAPSYWELSSAARAQYDLLQAQRVARLGRPTVAQRLAPSSDQPTLDGQPLGAQVSR